MSERLGDLIAGLARIRERVVNDDAFESAWFRFGARTLRVCARPADASVVPHGALAAAAPHEEESSVYIVQAEELGELELPTGLPLAPYGGLVDSMSTSWRIIWEPRAHRLLALDTVSRIALHLPDTIVPPRERAEFCRPLLHWLSILDGNVVIHAGGVARAGRGLLVAGAGNAGKSTLARVCLEAGFDYLGDNVVEVELSELGSRLHPTYPTFKIRRDPAVPVPADWPDPAWDDEAKKDIYFAADVAGARFARESTEHAATLVLDPRAEGPFSRLSTAQAFFLMAPNTVAQYPLHEEQVLKRSGRVLGAAPVYIGGRRPLEALADDVGALLAPITEGAVHGR